MSNKPAGRQNGDNAKDKNPTDLYKNLCKACNDLAERVNDELKKDNLAPNKRATGKMIIAELMGAKGLCVAANAFFGACEFMEAMGGLLNEVKPGAEPQNGVPGNAGQGK